MTSARRQLREALAKPGLVVAPFCWDGLTARLIEALSLIHI